MDWDEMAAKRRERILKMKREKERYLRRRKFFLFALPCLIVAAAACIALGIVLAKKGSAEPEKKYTSVKEQLAKKRAGEETGQEAEPDISAQDAQEEDTGFAEPDETMQEVHREPVVYAAHTTDATAGPPEEVDSTNAVLIDLESGEILVQRGYQDRINPASMTKVLTALVAAEHVTDLDDTFTITIDITDYSFVHDCSIVGFDIGETVTVRDLFYGTILPSGADAAVALAVYVAGSQEAFIGMMNEKLAELGLAESAHFTNCVGLYDEDHYCSVYDMAMIMEAAIDNALCREVLSARKYTTSATEQHPEGILISNWFLRRIEDKDTGGEVVCGKTGFVVQSKNCAVSFAQDAAGNRYVCATTGAHSSWRCIYDHVALYKAYAKSANEET